MSETTERPKILLADDDKNFCSLISNVLTGKGFSVVTAANGLMAEQILNFQKVDLVISDLKMSPVNGIELLHFVRNSLHVPVVLVTAHPEMANENDCLEIGASAFLQKPFNVDQLFNCISGFLPAKQYEVLSPEPESVDHLYCKIAIDDFVSGKAIVCDVYIRISPSKYLKIANQGDEISIERIKAYKEKEVEFLYLKSDDFQKYLGLASIIGKALEKTTTIAITKKIAFMRHSIGLVCQEMSNFPIDEKTFTHAKAVVDNSLNIVTNSEDLLEFIESLQNSADFLMSHSLAVSIYSVLIAKQMQWQSPGVLLKLALGGLFHDCGKKELPKEIISSPRNKLTAEQIQLQESHPLRGFNLLTTIRNIPDDVVRVALQHHENCTGTGFPSRLTKHQIHPFARIVAIADGFANLVNDNPNGLKFGPHAAIHRLYLQAQLYDAELLGALANAFRYSPETLLFSGSGI